MEEEVLQSLAARQYMKTAVWLSWTSKSGVKPVYCKVSNRVRIAIIGSIGGSKDCINGSANGTKAAPFKKQVAKLVYKQKLNVLTSTGVWVDHVGGDDAKTNFAEAKEAD